MIINNLFCEDCKVTMENMIKQDFQVDAIITSPPYNTVRQGNSNLSDKARKEGYGRYDVYNEIMSNDEYIEWTLELFNLFDKILKENGVIIYNLSYGSEQVELMWRVIYNILEETSFTISDNIIWKKKTAMPHPASKKLTRICEYIYILCREKEYDTHITNMMVSEKKSKNNQKYYKTRYNFIEAPNNDGVCNLNKATYSTELVLQLLDLYIPKQDFRVIYDPFTGTGTTANACKLYGVNYIGSEISEEQVKYANNRLNNMQTRLI